MTAQYDPKANELRSFHDARPAFADGGDSPRVETLARFWNEESIPEDLEEHLRSAGLP